jgi:glycosyltransferase involved in cell wall biosynthesis
VHAVLSRPLVTILINNYNYAAFLGAAIESALRQTHEPLEVLVVDDGSTDGSREVISRFGNAVRAIYKPNGGQASAFNTGFSKSRGEIVTFLDADDMLLETTVAQVVDAFVRNPTVGLIQCRVEVTDGDGTPLGIFIPPAYVSMPIGDLRGEPRDLINASWWSSTSGISVASRVLKDVLPLPEHLWPISADTGVAITSALCASVVSLEITGAYYRSHGGNYANRRALSISRTAAHVRREIASQAYIREFAERLSVPGYPSDPYSAPNPILLMQRMMLLKLGGRDDHLPGDTVRTVGWLGVKAALRRPDVGRPLKLLSASWFIIMAFLPRFAAQWVATKTLLQPNRPRFLAILTRTKRRRRSAGSSRKRAAKHEE